MSIFNKVISVPAKHCNDVDAYIEGYNTGYEEGERDGFMKKVTPNKIREV